MAQVTVARQLPPVKALTEEDKRRLALEFQAQMAARVTRCGDAAGGDVIPAPAGGIPAAEGPGKAEKIAKKPAAARAPETAAGARAYATGDPAGGPEKGEARQAGTSGRREAGSGKGQTEADPEIPESRKTKPNKRENEFFLNLMILRNTLAKNAPACRERARLAGKWVWRDIRLMLTLVSRIQDRMLRTMPASRDEYYSAYARHGHYELHIDGPVRTARHLLVTDKHLAAMAEAAMKSECILCMREGSEIGRCELREALLESAAPSCIDESGSMFRKCEYREAAGQLIQGKDVTV